MKKVSDVLRESSGSPIKKLITLSKLWRCVMTKNIASVTTPVKITSGVLFVLVHDNIWLTELNYMKEELVNRLNDAGLELSSMEFKYSPVYIKYEKPKDRLNEITDRELFYIEKFAGTIDNNDLKKSFKNAMHGYFQRHTFEEFINGN